VQFLISFFVVLQSVSTHFLLYFSCQFFTPDGILFRNAEVVGVYSISC